MPNQHDPATKPRWAPTDLVHAALLGDPAALESLVAAIWTPCFRLAASITGDWNLANDAAQEACIIVHNRLGTLRDLAAFDAWVYRIVIRESRRVARRHAERRVEAPLYELRADDTAALDVWRALAELNPQLREVTVLYYFDDLKGDEIATVLGVPHATVRKRLTRARERLRELLGDYRDDHFRTAEEQQHVL